MNFWIDVKIILNGMISKVERIIKTLNLLKKWKQKIDIDEVPTSSANSAY